MHETPSSRRDPAVSHFCPPLDNIQSSCPNTRKVRSDDILDAEILSVQVSVCQEFSVLTWLKSR